MNLKHGIFTVSLDFELYWGLIGKLSIDQYKYNLQGVRKAVPEMLHIFSDNNIHATWATVGFLFLTDSDELSKNIPKMVPTYTAKGLSPYQYIEDTVSLQKEFHFAPELIDLILQHKGQEIGTHTLSHYYCQEEGQSLAQFKEDISLAIKIAKRKDIPIKSLVFPRNQCNAEYFQTLIELGVESYRGNQTSWMYRETDDKSQNKAYRRAFRLIDAYLNLSGHNTHDLKNCLQEQPFNFPASRYLRPYSSTFSFLDGLRLRRIKNAMDDAAMNNRIFHLWWHPHDFGINTNKNIDFLAKIVGHYNLLKENHGMASMNMGELGLLFGLA